MLLLVTLVQPPLQQTCAHARSSLAIRRSHSFRLGRYTCNPFTSPLGMVTAADAERGGHSQHQPVSRQQQIVDTVAAVAEATAAAAAPMVEFLRHSAGMSASSQRQTSSSQTGTESEEPVLVNDAGADSAWRATSLPVADGPPMVVTAGSLSRRMLQDASVSASAAPFSLTAGTASPAHLPSVPLVGPPALWCGGQSSSPLDFHTAATSSSPSKSGMLSGRLSSLISDSARIDSGGGGGSSGASVAASTSSASGTHTISPDASLTSHGSVTKLRPLLTSIDDTPRQKLGEISQRSERLSLAGVDIRCMTITLPRVTDELSRAVWCPRNARGSGTGVSPRPKAVHSSSSGAVRTTSGIGANATTTHSPLPPTIHPTTPSVVRSDSSSSCSSSSSSSCGIDSAEERHGGGAPGTPTAGSRAPAGESTRGAATYLSAPLMLHQSEHISHNVVNGDVAAAPLARTKVEVSDDSAIDRRLNATDVASGGGGGARLAGGMLTPPPSSPHGMQAAASPASTILTTTLRASSGSAPDTDGLLLNSGVNATVHGRRASGWLANARWQKQPLPTMAELQGSAADYSSAAVHTGGGSGGGVPRSASHPAGLNTAAAAAAAQLPYIERLTFPGAKPSQSAAALLTDEEPQHASIPLHLMPQQPYRPSTQHGPHSARQQSTASSTDPHIGIADARTPASSRRFSGTRAMLSGPRDDAMVLENRMPEWNEKLSSLSMKFLGQRIGESSSKNFLMELLVHATAAQPPLHHVESSISYSGSSSSSRSGGSCGGDAPVTMRSEFANFSLHDGRLDTNRSSLAGGSLSTTREGFGASTHRTLEDTGSARSRFSGGTGGGGSAWSASPLAPHNNPPQQQHTNPDALSSSRRSSGISAGIAEDDRDDSSCSTTPRLDPDRINSNRSVSGRETMAVNKRLPCLQFGKVKGGRFSCDFRHPVAPIQAFGSFLTTFYWLVDEAGE